MSASRWLRRFHDDSNSPTQVVIFPHAGGAASYYYELSGLLSKSISVNVVQYPGRQDRYTEPPPLTIADYTNALLPEIDALCEHPVVLYGHSMGAIIAYELALRMSRSRRAVPAGLIVSGRRAPSIRRHEEVHKGDDATLIADVVALDGSSSEAFRDPDIRELVLPAIRSDYRAIETYVADLDTSIPCPITVLNGDKDPRSSAADAAAWKSHTSQEFQLEMYSGGHFFIKSHLDSVSAKLSAEIHRFVAGYDSLS